MGFRNPLGGIPPSSITAQLLAPGALDGQHLDHPVITNPTITNADADGGTYDTATLTRALALQAGNGASVHAWDFAVVTAAPDIATGQIAWPHQLGAVPTAVLVTAADDAAGITVRPASATASSIGFVARLPDGTPVDSSTTVTLYCWACR